ncbi:MAG: hypothetical protein QXW41_08180 [Fervidicoccaceae archaeon]
MPGIRQSVLTFQFSKRNIVIHLQLCIDVSVLLSLLKQIYGCPRTCGACGILLLVERAVYHDVLARQYVVLELLRYPVLVALEE